MESFSSSSDDRTVITLREVARRFPGTSRPCAFYDPHLDRISVICADCSICEECPDVKAPLVLMKDHYTGQYVGFAIDCAIYFCLHHRLVKEGGISLRGVIDEMMTAHPHLMSQCAIACRVLKESGYTKIELIH